MRLFHQVSGVVFCLLVVLGLCRQTAAQSLVKDGQPHAQIVIAKERPRMVTLAALELQLHVKQITGATLPIVTEPDGKLIPIYVGISAHTDKLGISPKGLKYGAYRMVSGDQYLALMGNDFDYVPPEPWPTKRNDMPRAQAAWEEILSKVNPYPWGYPYHSVWKKWWNGKNTQAEMLAKYGSDNEKLWPEQSYATGFWQQDEGGSLNAVYALLGDIGARWYMPGELGQVLPTLKTIALPKVDRTVHPDYAMRSWFWYGYMSFGLEDIIWARRIGLNSGEEIMGNIGHAHGHAIVTRGGEGIRKAHPEYFALIGNTRDTEHRGSGTLCYSSKGLEAETVKFIRFMFDQYNEPHVSIWPADGFKRCQCELCVGKSASELVWEFTDRVAREVYKTHPDRLITGGAYTTYDTPPDSISQFSPNLGVFLSNQGRPLFTTADAWDPYWKLVQSWQSRLAPGRLLRVENNRYSLHTPGPDPFPVMQARAMAKDLHALRGMCIGEVSEQSQSRGKIVHPAINSFPLYVQARFFWDANQDFDAMLKEYHELYYGPVAKEMMDTYLWAEKEHMRSAIAAEGKKPASPSNVPLKSRLELVTRLSSAHDKAGDTIYAQRIKALMDELPTIADLKQAIIDEANKPDPRANAPVAVAVPVSKAESAPVYDMKIITTGRKADVDTTFKVLYEDNAVIFDITCKEPDMANLKVTQDIWTGDSVGLLIETPFLSYYQIEVNPDGAIYDSDRGGGVGVRWESLATVKSERGDDWWRVVVRLPLASFQQGEADPNHQVVGKLPSKDQPWFFNIGRTRHSSLEKPTAYMFSPPLSRSYHVPGKFAKLIRE